MTLKLRKAASLLTPVALALAIFPSGACAAGVVPVVDLDVQAGLWQPQPTGTISSNGDEIDVEDDLNYEENDTNTFMVGLEHPVPLLPNVHVRHFSSSDNAKGEVQSKREFRGVTYKENTKVRSEYDITMTNATFYYSPLNNWIQLDLGITARQVDMRVLIEERDGSNSREASAKAVVPMGHIGARFDVPLAGLYVSGEVDAISAGDSSFQDAKAAVGYKFFDTFEIEGGYRRLSFDLDDVDDISADTDFQGAYAVATLRF